VRCGTKLFALGETSRNEREELFLQATFASRENVLYRPCNSVELKISWHASKGGNVKQMVSILALGILGTITGVGATSVATGDASTAIEAVKQAAPHGMQIALSHVPTWAHAHQVLSEHLSKYAEGGGVGATSGAGLAAALKSKAAQAANALLHH
jgi:hypothetical protein